MEPTVQEPQILSNESVRFSVHRKPACVVEFDVEATEKLVQNAYKKAVKAVCKEVTIPGFRKGKAPDALITTKYEAAINKEWEKIIADLAFAACYDLARIPLLHKNSKVTYKMKSHSPTGSLLTLQFETEPLIPSIDPKQFLLKSVKRPVVNEDKIEETIRQVQLFFAKWTPVSDRPIQEGDFVLLDVDVTEESPHTPLFSKTRFEVTSRSMAQWMYHLVLGKNVNDVLDGVSEPDPDASKEDLNDLKPKKVRLTILAVDTAELPPLDESFAKNVGADSIEDLRQKVVRLLESQADGHVVAGERDQAGHFLLHECPFDLPHSLIEKETHFRIEQLRNDKEFIAYWGSLSAEEKKKTMHTIQEQSGKAVRMFYLCRKIIADAKLSVSPNDIPPPSQSPLEFLLNPEPHFHHQQNPEIEHAEAFSRLVLEKAEDYLIAHATRETPPTP